MNFQFSSSNFPELEQLITTLFANNKCACHIINPHKTRILMWKEVKDGQTTYYLRIGIQKFSSQEQIDRNGEIYWRYYSAELKKEEKEVSKEQEGVHSELPQKETMPTAGLSQKDLPTQSEIDPVTKFNQRQAQAQNGKSNNAEQSVNNLQSN